MAAGGDTGTDRPLQGVLDLLSERAHEAFPGVRGGVDRLTLAEAGLAVETLNDVVESVWQLLGPVLERVAHIHEREMTERQEELSRDITEHAWVDLDCGRNGLLVAQRLLSTGRGELLRVERGAV